MDEYKLNPSLKQLRIFKSSTYLDDSSYPKIPLFGSKIFYTTEVGFMMVLILDL